MDKEVFVKRLKTAMLLKRYRQSDIVNEAQGNFKTQISRQNINSYLSGVNLPKQDKLEVIAKVLKVNPEWLMGANVPMEIENQPQATNNVSVVGENNIVKNIEQTVHQPVLERSKIVAVEPIDTMFDELVCVYKKLTIRNRIKLINTAYELEDNQK